MCVNHISELAELMLLCHENFPKLVSCLGFWVELIIHSLKPGTSWKGMCWWHTSICHTVISFLILLFYPQLCTAQTAVTDLNHNTLTPPSQCSDKPKLTGWKNQLWAKIWLQQTSRNDVAALKGTLKLSVPFSSASSFIPCGIPCASPVSFSHIYFRSTWILNLIKYLYI